MSQVVRDGDCTAAVTVRGFHEKIAYEHMLKLEDFQEVLAVKLNTYKRNRSVGLNDCVKT